ncbi:tetratricopeptide repeat protein [Cesiribacter sp. SM1]|uniref:ATP-binding protein n=1 Tax=Cesiribacter sp. SM1 TaxID=2861196 RepID=UPI001CD24721|nr:tetratricopeptide repeat protein [Cesiribacter sp. SM1]
MKTFLAAATFFLFLQLAGMQAAEGQAAEQILEAPADSLKRLLEEETNDSIRAALHRELGLEYKRASEPDLAIEQYKKSLAISTRLKDSESMAKCYNNLGSVYNIKGEFDLALNSYLNSLRLNEELGDKGGQMKNHINLGNFFAGQRNFEKAEGHYSRALELVDPGRDLNYEALLNLNLGGINTDPHNNKADQDKAILYFEKARVAFTKLEDPVRLAGVANNIGVVKEQQGKFREAYDSYYQALEIRRQIQDLPGVAQSYFNLGNIKYLLSDFNKALDFYKLSLAEARKIKARNQVQDALHGISATYASMKEHQKAFEYRLEYELLKDSLYNEEKSRQLAELETQYETEKKDKELIVKEASIKQKTAERNTYMITLAITVILSIVVIVVYHQRQRAISQLALKNEELHKRRISEMLKEQEIKSINAMLEGQDRERKRIAEDLHDRLGSTLSAVKLHLHALDGGIKQDAPLLLYQRVNGLLDKAVTEVRDIAHNMVSGVLTKFGLVAALQDLKETIEATNQVRVEIMVHNLDERLEGHVEIHLYRIIQELVSNILKHAKATEIIIQLNKHNHELLLMVEDNGVGFNPGAASLKKGMGLRNIESRVSSLGGSLSIDSGRGGGTTTTIEIPVA